MTQALQSVIEQAWEQRTELSPSAAPAEVREWIEEGLARHAMVGAGTGKDPKGSIPPNHAYMVFGYDRERDLVVTWNPWNNDFTPKGPSNRQNGYARRAGVAEIPLEDFAQMFRGLTVETDRTWDGKSMPERKGAPVTPPPAGPAPSR